MTNESAARKPRAPARLGPRGRRFWKQTTALFDFAVTETDLLEQSCRVLDRIDQLQKAIENDGVSVAGSRGQVVVHPAVAEIRMQEATLVRILAALCFPGPEQIESASAQRGRKAAETRWQIEHAKWGSARRGAS